MTYWKEIPQDAYTNGYNHEIFHLWGTNIDFQFVLDEYSTIMYVCSYMMKSEKAIEEVLKSVSKECQSDPIDEQLKKIGKAFIGNYVIGAPEAAMRELSMWLMKKSQKVTFVNSNMQDDHISLPKSTKMLDNMDDDEDNVYMTSKHDRYSACPNNLEGICLAKFAVNYEPLLNSGGNDEGNNIFEHAHDSDDKGNKNDDWQESNIIILKNNMGKMHKRRNESILHVKWFRQNTERERYYHSQLILYLTWCNEDELLGRYSTYKKHYVEVYHIVEHNAEEFHFHSEEKDSAINDIADNGPPEMDWDAIVPTIDEGNVQSVDDDQIIICNVDSEDEDNDWVHDLDIDPSSGDNDSEKMWERIN